MTMIALLPALTIVAILGAGLIAGTFFAFSTFVMPALVSRPANEAIPAMQQVNIVVVRSLFIAVFLGTAGVSAVLIVFASIEFRGTTSVLAMAGAAMYIAGSFMVTVLFNVPKNNALARLDADDAGSEKAWAEYAKSWTRWNHVRTIASAAATVLFSVSLLDNLLR